MSLDASVKVTNPAFGEGYGVRIHGGGASPAQRTASVRVRAQLGKAETAPALTCGNAAGTPGGGTPLTCDDGPVGRLPRTAAV